MLNKSLPDILDGFGTTGKCIRDLSIRPCRTIRISLEQHQSTANSLASPLEILNHLSTDLAFRIGQAKDTLLLTQLITEPSLD